MSVHGDTPASARVALDGVTTIPELMRRIRDAYGWSDRGVADYLGLDKGSVNAWINDRGSAPGPLRCWKIADFLASGRHDLTTWLWVMQIAGHMPDDFKVHAPGQEVMMPPALPDWVRVIPRLTPRDAELVERMVESLARTPLQAQ